MSPMCGLWIRYDSVLCVHGKMCNTAFKGVSSIAFQNAHICDVYATDGLINTYRRVFESVCVCVCLLICRMPDIGMCLHVCERARACVCVCVMPNGKT